jgi:hypothetical protein
VVDHFSTTVGELNQWQEDIDLAVAAPVFIWLKDRAYSNAKGSKQGFWK